MNDKNIIEEYINELRSFLTGLKPWEIEDIEMNIRSHIQDASLDGRPILQIIASLGSPKEIAIIYNSKNISSKPKLQLKKAKKYSNSIDWIVLILWMTFLGPTALIVLASLVIAFGISTLCSPIGGLLYSFRIPFLTVGFEEIKLPYFLGLPVGLMLGIIFLILTYICWILFCKVRKYILPKNKILVNL